MSDEIEEKEDELLPPERSGKVAVLKYMGTVFTMISQNKTTRQITSALQSEYSLTYNQAYKFYKKAIEQLEEDNQEKINAIRYKKISALEKDLQTTWDNYQDAEDSLKLKWFEVYLKVKSQLDQYYPNALKPEAEKDDLHITISYSNSKPLDDDKE